MFEEMAKGGLSQIGSAKKRARWGAIVIHESGLLLKTYLIFKYTAQKGNVLNFLTCRSTRSEVCGNEQLSTLKSGRQWKPTSSDTEGLGTEAPGQGQRGRGIRGCRVGGFGGPRCNNPGKNTGRDPTNPAWDPGFNISMSCMN